MQFSKNALNNTLVIWNCNIKQVVKQTQDNEKKYKQKEDTNTQCLSFSKENEQLKTYFLQL